VKVNAVIAILAGEGESTMMRPRVAVKRPHLRKPRAEANRSRKPKNRRRRPTRPQASDKPIR
jgi:hypothetical protein